MPPLSKSHHPIGGSAVLPGVTVPKSSSPTKINETVSSTKRSHFSDELGKNLSDHPSKICVSFTALSRTAAPFYPSSILPTAPPNAMGPAPVSSLSSPSAPPP